MSSHKHLGLVLSNDCPWHQHIDYITKKAWNRINILRKLKFKLDRSSLEIIFTTFIRPLLEYGDIVWDNCTQFEKQEIEKIRIQIEAARIATGTNKLVSLNALYQETGLVTLEKRPENHKLVMFYKMYNDLTPSYLSSLVPQSINNLSQYSLRNADNLQPIHARTNLYFQSFLPSVARKWNDLSDEAKRSSSVTSFKNSLNRNRTSIPKYFYTGNRKTQILHTRLRTKYSSLNSDLYSKNITESPFCRCGQVENSHPYLLCCPFYTAQRNKLFNAVSEYQTISLNLLLYGDASLPYTKNVLIFEKVQKYISDTNAFNC